MMPAQAAQSKNRPTVMTFEIECCSGGSSCESGTFSILNEVLRSIVVKMKGCRVEAAVMILLVLLLESVFFWKCIKNYVKSDFVMPCPFRSLKLFWSRPNCFRPVQIVLDRSKIGFHFGPSPHTFGPVQNNFKVLPIFYPNLARSF